jgi:acyl carrier protein
MTQDDCLLELADILNVPRGTLTPDTLLATVTWDSMALMAYLAFLRFNFQVTFKHVSCSDFTTVADLLAPTQK